VSEDPRVIVVGCDGDADSDPALRFAFDEARERRTSVLLVTSYCRPVDSDVDEFDAPDDVLQDRAKARVERALHRAIGGEPVDLPSYAIVAKEGDPAHVIVSEGAEAAMIVIGSHDRALLKRMLGHLTREHIVHDSRVPVTVVPHP
jgi:nucleotide-binding universal stress UspA family protein